MELDPKEKEALMKALLCSDGDSEQLARLRQDPVAWEEYLQALAMQEELDEHIAQGSVSAEALRTPINFEDRALDHLRSEMLGKANAPSYTNESEKQTPFTNLPASAKDGAPWSKLAAAALVLVFAGLWLNERFDKAPVSTNDPILGQEELQILVSGERASSFETINWSGPELLNEHYIVRISDTNNEVLLLSDKLYLPQWKVPLEESEEFPNRILVRIEKWTNGSFSQMTLRSKVAPLERAQ